MTGSELRLPPKAWLCRIGVHRWRDREYNDRYCHGCGKEQVWRPGIYIGENGWWDV